MEIDQKLAELEKIKEEWAAVQHKIDIANHVEKQFDVLASEGKIKHDDQGNFELVDDPSERQFLKETARKNREMGAQQIQDSEQIRDEVRQNLMDKLNQVVDDVDDEFD